MREAIVPLTATIVLAFVVHRWAADELERERRLSRGAATAAVALIVLHALLVLISSAGGVASIGAPSIVTLSIGLTVSAAGGLLSSLALRALGSRDRILAMRIDIVVAHGPYRNARHPFYLGWTMALLGIAVAGRSLLALGLVALLALGLARIARGEERLMSQELGAAYEKYRDRAPAVIGRAKAPATT